MFCVRVVVRACFDVFVCVWFVASCGVLNLDLVCRVFSCLFVGLSVVLLGCTCGFCIC